MIDVLHIREKQRTAREHIEWYMALKKLLPQSRITINDRLDAAIAVKADGVQLAWHSVDVWIAKQILPSRCLIGCSVHNIEEATTAEAGGADYVLFGHVYETDSKAGLAGRGVAALQAVVSAVSIPVIALGGITADHVAEVMKSGCAGVAVMSAFFSAPDSEIVLRKMRDTLDKRRS